MPALPAVPKVVKVAHKWSDGINLDIVTRQHVQYSGTAPSNADLDDYCAAIAGDPYLALAALVGGALTLIGIEAIDLSSDTGSRGSWTGAVGGSRSGNPVAIDTAFVTSYVIARRYRGGHPRGYWPFGVSVDLSNVQHWLDDFVAEVGGTLTDYRTAMRSLVWGTGGSLSFVSVSYYSGWTIVERGSPARAYNVPTLRAGGPVVDAVSTFIPRGRIGTQRRRAQY